MVNRPVQEKVMVDCVGVAWSDVAFLLVLLGFFLGIFYLLYRIAKG